MTRTTRRDFAKMMALGLPLATRQLNGARQAIDSRARRPDVLILVFDTLSASHMSLYGYPRKTTPNIERFMRSATVYDAHYAGGNFTTPGTSSLLTGALPWSHRAFNHAGRLSDEYAERNAFKAFREAGYRTLAYSHNQLACSLLYQCGASIERLLHPSSYCLFDGGIASAVFSRDADTASRSFDDFLLQRGQVPGSLFLSLIDRVRMRLPKSKALRMYREDFPRGLPELFKLFFRLEDVIDGMKETISEITEPTLAYFHVLPPHEPYRPHRDFVGAFTDDLKFLPKPASQFSEGVANQELRGLRLQYDEYLAYTDFQLGRLLDFLETSGRLEHTIVVFTSDHGQLFERGIHGHITQTLYEPLVRVPLIIRAPGQTGGQRVSFPTSCVDVLPTVADLAGLRIPDWCEGRSLFNRAEGEADPVFAVEAKQNPKDAPLNRATFMMRKENQKLVYYRGQTPTDDAWELFDLYNDPEERRNQDPSVRELADLRSELEVEIGKRDKAAREKERR
jgi:arylsulfatase A-like enzyme